MLRKKCTRCGKQWSVPQDEKLFNTCRKCRKALSASEVARMSWLLRQNSHYVSYRQPDEHDDTPLLVTIAGGPRYYDY